MDVTAIPFNKFIGIGKNGQDKNLLELVLRPNLINHLGTMHASAQFALAEACSGQFLQEHFPELANSVIPVVRKAELKFRKPAEQDIQATAGVHQEALEKFMAQFTKKGRAVIAVPVQLQDKNGTVTMTGLYEWFVQKIEHKEEA